VVPPGEVPPQIGNVPQFDPELDKGSSPRVQPPTGELTASERADLADLENISVEELQEFDPETHWFSFGLSFLRNSNKDGEGTYFVGGGARYAVNTGRLLFLKDNKSQDSFSLEGGAFFYKVLNFDAANDSYTVMPLQFTGRYNVMLGEGFGFFFYGGLMRNIVIATNANAVQDTTDAFSSWVPCIGTGLLFRVGPNWLTRVDLGYDMIGLGLSLRF
jgi:hypothetical protein